MSAAKEVFELISLKNPVFTTFVAWSSILALKMMLMSALTGIQRIRTKAFVNPEDVTSAKGKIKFNDDDVERVRRAHRNDLENVLPFLTAGLFYVLTNPSVSLATTLFAVAAISRILHTVVYTIVIIPQPARALAFTFPLGITIYFAISSILYFF